MRTKISLYVVISTVHYHHYISWEGGQLITKSLSSKKIHIFHHCTHFKTSGERKITRKSNSRGEIRVLNCSADSITSNLVKLCQKCEMTYMLWFNFALG